MSAGRDFGKALRRLRENMRANVWKVGAHQINLERIVAGYDSHIRHSGFHVLNDWDGIADHVNEDTIPVDVLNYLLEQRGAGPPDPASLAILLDYYFLYVLALLSLKIWDDGDADVNLGRLNHLVRDLQGPHGSGQQFSANAETLILIATSHYEIEERGFDTLLARVRTLNRAHRLNIAVAHAASIGSHLRFGFAVTYGRDTITMRNDNKADYPWLCFAVATVMEEYSRLRDEGTRGTQREAVVEAMLNGLSPDARAFIGNHPPESLASCQEERCAFRDRFHQYRPDLLEEFESYRPSADAYSPLSFFFNFSHNVLKGTVVDALLAGKAWNLTLDDLLTSIPRAGSDADAKERLARTLTGYARANPHRIRGRLAPVIVYDPQAGREAFAVTMRKIREQGTGYRVQC